MGTFVFWLFAVLFTLVAAAAALKYFYSDPMARRRERALDSQARTMKLSFSTSDSPELLAYTGGMLTRGRFARVFNVTQGTWRGRPVYAFDCKHGDFFMSICLVPLDASLPDLVIQPHTVADKLRDQAIADNVALESEDFSSWFHVGSSSRKFAYDVCHPRMMTFLMENAGKLGIRIIRSHLVVSDGWLWSPEEYRQVLHVSADFLDLIPEHVWRLYGRRVETP